MEGLHLEPPRRNGVEHHLSPEEQRQRRTIGRLLDLMIDRAENSNDPAFTLEVVFERIASVKDDFVEAQALLDREIELHPEPIVDQWGGDPRQPLVKQEV